MNIAAVRKFLSVPDENLRFLRDPTAFLGVDWGQDTEETVSRWNQIVGPEFAVTATPEDADNEAGFTDKFEWQGNVEFAPYVGSREDCFIAVLTLNKLVSKSIDMRFCVDSVGNSDLWFLPLPAEEWARLESEFGAKLISERFRRLPASFEEFAKYLE